MMPFLFQMIGGRSVPWMAQVRTALRPTVTVEMLICWSSARLSWTTSVRMRARRREIGEEREWMIKRQWQEERDWGEMEKERENRKSGLCVCWSGGTVAKLHTFLRIHLITSGARRINSCPGVKDTQHEKRPRVRGHTASQISFFSLREIYVHWNGHPIQFTFTAN